MVCKEYTKEKICDQRNVFVSQVRRWGDLNTDAVLDSTCKTFSVPDIEGCIGYREELTCAVVFGEPLCDPRDQKALVTAFHAFCQERGMPWVYVMVSEEFAKVIHSEFSNGTEPVLIHFGNKLIFDTAQNPLEMTGPKGVLIRKKVKHATHDGVVIHEYHNEDPTFEEEIEKMGKAWLSSRHGPQVYIAHHDFFHDREGKRCFYAKKGEQIVGFLMLNRVDTCSGWLLNNLIVTSDSPSGTSESLIVTALKTLSEEGCPTLVVGPVTGTDIHQIVGLSAFSSWVIRSLFNVARKLFRLDGQRVFWEKFPSRHEPSFLVFNRIGYRTVKALLRGINVNT